MSVFTENTSIEALKKENLWGTTEPLVFYTMIDDKREYITVPVWFKFDGASVPRFLWFLFPPAEPRSIDAACLHDYLFETRQYSLWKTDLIFLEALEALWMVAWRRYLMFLWLKMGSWLPWYIYPLINKYFTKFKQFIWKK